MIGAGGDGRERGWWRRNWWGLAGVLPILAAAVLLSPNESYDRLRDARPQAVTPDPQGWVDYRGARLRLAEFGPAELRDSLGGPFPLPAEVRPWQAIIRLERLPEPDTLSGCEIELEDAAGRRFGSAPSELAAAYGPDGSGLPLLSCVSFDEATELGPFDVVASFLLPASARPVALRLTHFLQVPEYVRLPVD